MKKRILLISVFLCGACVMAMELVGSRVLAPFVGATMAVWTSLIGVILGAMSLGYIFGGKLADKNPKFETFSLIIGLSGLSVALLGMIKNTVLINIVEMQFSNEIKALIAAVVLFAAPGFLLAMVSPYAIKLSLTSFENTGRTAGDIYAVSTVGSITGTFLAGFFLIPSFGSTTILYVISIVLILLSIFVSIGKKIDKSVILKAIILLFALSSGFTSKNASAFFNGAIAEHDTQYGTIFIVENENMRTMRIDTSWSSGKYLDSDELAFEYTNFYDLAMFFNPNVKRALAIGGAGYSYPRYFIDKYPDKALDVVEINPKTTELAREYFGLKDNPRMNIFHNDARIFLNKNEIKYDAVFGDAFSTTLPPFQLVTKEASERIYDSLSDDGVYIVNIISALEGESSKLFSSYYHTLLQVFQQVLVFTPVVEQDITDIRNITLIALKKPANNLVSGDAATQEMLDKIYDKTPEKTLILTDDYAPVESFL